MVGMEEAEQAIYAISMWGRYIPGFGIIGLLIGANLIIFGSILNKYLKTN
jgi:flagellar motor component MotA